MTSAQTDPVKQQVVAHWDRRAAHFDEDFGHSIRTAAERAAWDRILDLTLPAGDALEALDIGCGTGFFSLELAFLGHRVTGVNFAPSMIAQARKKAAFELIPRTALSTWRWSTSRVPSTRSPGRIPGTSCSRWRRARPKAACARFWRGCWRPRSKRISSPTASLPKALSKLGSSGVPVSRVADFIIRATACVTERLPGIRPMAFGHVGDGNIHFNLTQPAGADTAGYLARWQEFNDIVHGVVRELHGSISAEHGVGRLKRDEITHYKSPVEIESMRRVKHALDPDNIMNPVNSSACRPYCGAGLYCALGTPKN
jgi:FAD linked oxidases, C-terminal domain/Methyltransferase domain